MPRSFHRPPNQRANQRPRWQFGLGSLLLMVLALGPVLGLGVPLVVRVIREYQAKAPVAAPPVPRLPDPSDYEAGVYYESAETPLD